MRRVLYQTGLTANAQLGVCAPNLRWLVKYAKIKLVTSATAGTRSAQIQIWRANENTSAEILCQIPNQTGVSTTYSGIGSILNTVYETGGTLVQYYAAPDLSSADIIYLVVTLIAGDAVTYWIGVEEEKA